MCRVAAWKLDYHNGGLVWCNCMYLPKRQSHEVHTAKLMYENHIIMIPIQVYLEISDGKFAMTCLKCLQTM